MLSRFFFSFFLKFFSISRFLLEKMSDSWVAVTFIQRFRGLIRFPKFLNYSGVGPKSGKNVFCYKLSYDLKFLYDMLFDLIKKFILCFKAISRLECPKIDIYGLGLVENCPRKHIWPARTIKMAHRFMRFKKLLPISPKNHKN